MHALSKPSLVNLISKDASLLFYLLVTSYLTVQTSHYGVIIDFRVNSMSLFKSFKKVQRHDDPNKGTCGEIDNVYQADVQRCNNMSGN